MDRTDDSVRHTTCRISWRRSLCRRLTSRTASPPGDRSDAVRLLFAGGPVADSGRASPGRSGALIAARRLAVLVPPISSDAQRPLSSSRLCRLRVGDKAETRQRTVSRQLSTPHRSVASASSNLLRGPDAHIKMVNKLSLEFLVLVRLRWPEGGLEVPPG